MLPRWVLAAVWAMVLFWAVCFAGIGMDIVGDASDAEPLGLLGVASAVASPSTLPATMATSAAMALWEAAAPWICPHSPSGEHVGVLIVAFTFAVTHVVALVIGGAWFLLAAVVATANEGCLRSRLVSVHTLFTRPAVLLAWRRRSLPAVGGRGAFAEVLQWACMATVYRVWHGHHGNDERHVVVRLLAGGVVRVPVTRNTTVRHVLDYVHARHRSLPAADMRLHCRGVPLNPGDTLGVCVHYTVGVRVEGGGRPASAGAGSRRGKGGGGRGRGHGRQAKATASPAPQTCVVCGNTDCEKSRALSDHTGLVMVRSSRGRKDSRFTEVAPLVGQHCHTECYERYAPCAMHACCAALPRARARSTRLSSHACIRVTRERAGTPKQLASPPLAVRKTS